MRPTTPYLVKSEWEVHVIELALVQRLVALHHYAKGGSNTATFRHGLFRRDDPDTCWGVAWWIPPTKSAAMASYDGDWRQVLTLSRMVIVPEAPTNSATFLLMQSVKLIMADRRFKCLVTYADTWQGHKGTIYKAANWEYVGLTTPEATFVDVNGRLVARKAGPHTRTRAEMEQLGHKMIGRFSKHKYRMVLAS